MSDAPELHPDYFLTGMARQISHNYHQFPQELRGGRLYFFVADGAGGEDRRTLVFDADQPRLYDGIMGEADESVPFVLVRLTRPQLAQFFAGTLEPSAPENQNVEMTGNSEALYLAIGQCLG